MSLEERVLADIQTFFNGEFECTLANLHRPTYVFVRDFYAKALMEFEVDTDNVRRATHLIDGVGRDSVEIIGDITFVAAINKVFNFLNFGLFDLLSPEDNSRRTVNMMAMVLEFLGLADELTEKLNDGFEEKRAQRAQLALAEERIENMRQQMSQLAIEKSQISQKKIALQNKISKLKAKRQEMSKDVENADKVINLGKRETKERKAALGAARVELEKVKSSTESMKEELLSAQSLGTKEEERLRSEEERQLLHEKYLERVETKKKLSAALDAIKKFSSKVEEMSLLIDQVKYKGDKLASITDELNEMKKTVEDLNDKRIPIEAKAKALEEYIENASQAAVAFKNDSEKNIADMRKRETCLMDSIRASNDVINVDERKLSFIDKDIAEEERIFLDYVARTQSIIKKLERKSRRGL